MARSIVRSVSREGVAATADGGKLGRASKQIKVKPSLGKKAGRATRMKKVNKEDAASAGSREHGDSPDTLKVTACVGKKVGGGKKKKVEETGATMAASDSSEAERDNSAPPEMSTDSTLKSGKQKQGPSRDMEVELWERGFQHVAGVDEVGRGPLAGPVVAAACIIPSSITIEGIDDSKKLSEDAREELFMKLTSTPGISYAVHVIDAGAIDKINILQATMQAMTACVEKLHSAGDGLPGPDFILVDGDKLPTGFSKKAARSVVKGDAKSYVIAAASILAKVTRDRLMIPYDEKWPEYGFKSHKGYGTPEHLAALRKHGPCDIHRRSFAPVTKKYFKFVPLSKTFFSSRTRENSANEHSEIAL